MTPRGFDRYMVAIGMGTHPKLAGLTDSEFRAHVVGVLAVAAMSPVRGRLLVGSSPAEPLHIAAVAKVPERVAASAMRKLTAIGILRPDDEHACLRVHDWDDINPSPGAARTRRWRDGTASPERHENVTKRHENVTRTSPEVKKVEEEEPASQVNTNAELRSAVIECFSYWQEKCGHKQAQLDPKRRRSIEGRLRDRQRHHSGDLPQAILDVRLAVDGAALAPFVDDRGKRHDDIELVCRNVPRLEDFMGRATSKVPLRVVRGRDTSASPKSLEEMDARTRERIERLQADLGAEDFQASKEQR